MSSLRQLLPRIAVLLAAVALPTAAAELYVRTFRPVVYRMPPPPMPRDQWRNLAHRRSSIPGLSYELNPGRSVKHLGVKVDINQMGLRSYEPLSPAQDRRRIAVVGDSYAFGFGVKLPETFGSVMEESLNSGAPGGGPSGVTARSYEVMNFAVGGYSTLDEAAVVEHRVRAWAPALIVVAYSLNDPEDDPVQPVHSHYQRVQAWQYSHLLRLVAVTYLQTQIRRHGGGDYHRYLHQSPAKWGSVQRGFTRIERAAAAIDAPVLLAIFPHSVVKDWKAYPYRDLHRQVTAEAREHGLHTLDLLPAMEKHLPLQVRRGALDDHPNALGHRLAAQALVAYLRETELLGE